MSRAQRRARLYPPSIVVGTATLLLIAAATLSAAPPPPAAAVAACSSDPGTAVRQALAASPARSANSAASAARVRVADILGARGEFLGRRLDVTPSAGTAFTVTLPAESSVSQPQTNLVVYTQVVGGRSEVRAIDLVTGCDYLVAQPTDVARSAILDASGSYVYVHSVTARGRADAGVSRYATDDGRGSQVVAPLPVDARYGQTFGTQLSVNDDGSTLAVQSCGFEACRTSLLDIASGTVQVLDDVAHGELVGVTATDLIVFDACNLSPCAVLAIDRASGEAEVLATDALDAELARDSANTVQIDTAAGSMEVLP